MAFGWLKKLAWLSSHWVAWMGNLSHHHHLCFPHHHCPWAENLLEYVSSLTPPHRLWGRLGASKEQSWGLCDLLEASSPHRICSVHKGSKLPALLCR